jgi:tripeptide aminopeptidase
MIISSIEERFLRYVQIDTTADPEATCFPSTEKQKDLSRVLVTELKAMGIVDAEMDQWGYVYATIPSNSENKSIPTICFCSHVDTAPDCSGTHVKPIVHRNYQGQDIILPDDNSQIITTAKHPYLNSKIGDDIITASGLTLLGADDKAGVAIIMDFAQFMMQNASILHGDIKILFTPDEEIGRGVEYIDMNRLNADFAYTLDGGPLGDIEDETFSADAMDVTFEGLSAHPGYAKGKMINAIKLAAEFVSKLPNTNLSPETTLGREGFVHPTSVSGGLESALVQFIIRDHDTSKLKIYEDFLVELAQSIVDQYKGSKFTFKVKEQYRNMKEELVKVPFVADYAVEAMIKANVTPKRAIIRGGTDGSRLSFMGLPCPNIFTGEMAIHSRHEYVSVQDMLAAKNTLIELVQIWTNHKTKNG